MSQIQTVKLGRLTLSDINVRKAGDADDDGAVEGAGNGEADDGEIGDDLAGLIGDPDDGEAEDGVDAAKITADEPSGLWTIGGL